MFRGRRARPRLTAVAAVLLASLGAGPLVLPHTDSLGDAACYRPAVSHDESAHRFGGAASPDATHQQHCALCHWVRTFCSLLPTGEHVQDDPARHVRLNATSILAHHHAGWSLTPGRAPPA